MTILMMVIGVLDARSDAVGTALCIIGTRHYYIYIQYPTVYAKGVKRRKESLKNKNELVK